MIDWSFEIENKATPSSNDVTRSALINLRNNLKTEIEDQEISRSIRNYKKELMESVVMVIKHYK